jgi:hypothetical protein
MKKQAASDKLRKRTPRRRQSTVVPPITVSFEEAVSRLVKVKPPKKARASRATEPKSR